MSFDFAVLKTRLDTLALDGNFPDTCLTRESAGNAGHIDFVFLLGKKTVGIVRLPCTESQRSDMHTRVLEEIERIRIKSNVDESGRIVSPKKPEAR